MPLADKKELLTVLRLDDVNFQKTLSKDQQQVLAFSASVGAIGVSFLAAAKSAATYNDEAIKSARAAGANVEVYTAYRHAADLAGLSNEQLQKTFQKLARPTSQMEKDMSSMGVSVRDASGDLKSQGQILTEMSERYQDLENPADKARLALSAFGEEGGRVANLLASDLETVTEQARAMGLVVTEEAGLAAEKFNDDTAVMIGSLEGLKNSIGSTIVEFLNQGEVMGRVSKTIQNVTLWWQDLDEEYKEVIVTAGAIATGVALVTTGLLGVVAVAPAVTAAITAMTGGLNLVIAGVAAVAAVTVAEIAYMATHWEKFEKYFDPITRNLREAKMGFEDLFNAISSGLKEIEPVQKVISDIGDVFDDLTEGSEDIDVFATAIKANLFPVVAIFTIMTGAARTLGESLSTLWTVMANGGSIGDAFTAAMDRAASGVARIKRDITGQFEDIITAQEEVDRRLSRRRAREDNNAPSQFGKKDPGKKESYEFQTAWLAAFQNVGSAYDDLREKLSPKDGEVKWLRVADSVGVVTQELSKLLSVAGNTVSAVASVQTAYADVANENLKRSTEESLYNLDILNRVVDRQVEREIKQVEDAENAKIRNLEGSYEIQIAMAKEASDARIAILEGEQERQDEIREAEFQKRLEQAKRDFDLQTQKFLDATRVDEEQRIIQEERDAEWNARIRGMREEFDAEQDILDEANRAQRISAEQEEKNKIALIEQQKADAVAAAEAEKEARLAKLQADKEKRQKDSARLQTAIEYAAEVQSVEINKGAQSSQTTQAAIAGASQAFSALAAIPFVGWALGSAAAAAILAAGSQSVQQIQTQKVPVPPSLVFEAGTVGMIQGPSHAAGGVPIQVGGTRAEAEGGELMTILSRRDTRDFLSNFNDPVGGRSMQRGDVRDVNITNVFPNMTHPTPEFARQVGEKTIEELQSLGVT